MIGKVCGPHSIPIRVMKILKFIICKPLEILFNASFSQRVVPSSFKIAKVIPIYRVSQKKREL
jgi:hypothetical protein